MTPDDDLAIARSLAQAGVPVFVAYPDPAEPTGYRLPRNWQTTTPNPAYIDAWKPGLALCAVMGHGIDLVDIDPRNGGNLTSIAATLPPVLGEAASPSGGQHIFVQSMGVGSRDAVMPGIDIKAGDTDGQGRGFAFIAPTTRPSKITGELSTYQWTTPPDTTRINGQRATSSALAGIVRSARQGGRHRLFTGPEPLERKHAGPIPYGEHHAQLVAYAGWLRSKAIPLQPEAETLMLRRLTDLIQPADATRPRYTPEEALTELRDVYNRYPAGDPAAEQQLATSDTPASLPEYDLGQLAAKGRPQRPEMLAGNMLYPGLVHCLAGQPGGGKTTLMAWWMLQHIREGGNVMLLDEESGPEQAAEKFLDLGATPDELSPPRFTYVPFPSRRWNDTDIRQLHELISDRAPQIIGWDSIAALLAVADADENAAPDVTKFWQKVLLPCARQFGAAVIGLDHVVKDGEHGGFGRGSGAKKAASDVQYMLHVKKAFNRYEDGLLRLTTTPGKDRRGWLLKAYEVRVQVGQEIELTITEALSTDTPAGMTMTEGQHKLWNALTAVATAHDPASIKHLQDHMARKGDIPLKRQTCSTWLNQFAAAGLADSCSLPGQTDKFWFPLSVTDTYDTSALTGKGEVSSASASLKGADADDTLTAPRQFRQP